MYHKLGKIPHKRHTIFKGEDGQLRYEELFGNEGFSGSSSLLYHVHRPTQVTQVAKPVNIEPVVKVSDNITSRKIKGEKIGQGQDWFNGKKNLFFNADITIAISHFENATDDVFYKNATGDELFFIHQGKGVLKTFLGEIPFSSGDYLLIPKGIIYQFDFKQGLNKVLYIGSSTSINFPKRYLGKNGQFLEHSPICERDLRLPQNLVTVNEKGDFKIRIQKQGFLHEVSYAYHPFDVVGWDGYCFPFAISIHDFEPITGSIHMPPPIHQMFESRNFVVCSFCPRMFDYHPQAIPAPYHHSNIDSDEVLYYVEGDFMSRDSIECGDFTLHPAGIPHGPHPGTIEGSIGKKRTEELAVMIDTFNPLKITAAAVEIEDRNYFKSWTK